MGKANRYYVSKGFLSRTRSYFTVFVVELVIDFGGKALLVRRKEEPLKGQWFVPGGRVYKTEPVEKAAVRVAMQETGLRCRVMRQLPPSREIFAGYKGKNMPKDGVFDTIGMVFLMKPAGGQIRLDSTSSEYMLVDRIRRDFHPYLKRILRSGGVLRV